MNDAVYMWCQLQSCVNQCSASVLVPARLMPPVDSSNPPGELTPTTASSSQAHGLNPTAVLLVVLTFLQEGVTCYVTVFYAPLSSQHVFCSVLQLQCVCIRYNCDEAGHM